MAKNNIFAKLSFFVKDFFAHWNIPAKDGYYLSNKEFVAYSVGGMGVQGMGILTQYFAINMGVHLAYVYNFDQSIVLYTTWIVAILSIFRAPLVGWIIDNTNTKWGKYRPYLLWTGLLSVVCFWLLAFIPQLFMPGAGQPYTEARKWAVIGSYQLIYFIALTVYGFFSFGRVGLSQVITPNTNERTKLYSVGGVIDSLGPSIVQMLFPLIANWVYGQQGLVYGDTYGSMTAEQIAQTGMGFGMENIHTYQIIFPIMGCVCVAVALIMFFGTKERLIQAKTQKLKVKFMAGIVKSFKNKYFWIFNISNILAFGRITLFASVNYICAYLIGGDLGGNLRGIMPTVMAIGFVPGMLFSPIIQKYMGKKKDDVAFFRRLGDVVRINIVVGVVRLRRILYSVSDVRRHFPAQHICGIMDGYFPGDDGGLLRISAMENGRQIGRIYVAIYFGIHHDMRHTNRFVGGRNFKSLRCEYVFGLRESHCNA